MMAAVSVHPRREDVPKRGVSVGNRRTEGRNRKVATLARTQKAQGVQLERKVTTPDPAGAPDPGLEGPAAASSGRSTIHNAQIPPGHLSDSRHLSGPYW